LHATVANCIERQLLEACQPVLKINRHFQIGFFIYYDVKSHYVRFNWFTSASDLLAVDVQETVDRIYQHAVDVNKLNTTEARVKVSKFMRMRVDCA
jgi:hypothetical protein